MVYALVNLDVNNFAYVNENYGQEAGDSILQDAALITASPMSGGPVEWPRIISLSWSEERTKRTFWGLWREDRCLAKQLKIRYPAGAMQLSAGICFIDDGKDVLRRYWRVLAGTKAAKEQNAGAVIYREDMRKTR